MLLSDGHSNVYDYTFRQLKAMAQLAIKRHKRRHLELLSAVRMAYHGDKKELDRYLKDFK